MSGRKLKIEFVKGALDDVPEEERAELEETITELIADFDPDDPPGRPVYKISAGITSCPRCGSPFPEPKHVDFGPDRKIAFFHCDSCEETFMTESQ